MMYDKQKDVREHYLGIGVALGSCFGVALGAAVGIALGNLALGIAVGIAFGTGLGIVFGAMQGKKHSAAAPESLDTRSFRRA